MKAGIDFQCSGCVPRVLAKKLATLVHGEQRSLNVSYSQYKDPAPSITGKRYGTGNRVNTARLSRSGREDGTVLREQVHPQHPQQNVMP